MVRLFIAVPVPAEVKDKIADLAADLEKVHGLPPEIRFVPEQNWHFTLVFLGYQPESSVSIIKPLLTPLTPLEVTVQFEKITYGPPGRTPRMIWLATTGDTSAALGRIKGELERELTKTGIKWRPEFRPYQGHLTLARFEPVPLKNLPKIDKRIDWRYETGEINLMKSNLKRTGAEYEVLL